MTDKITGKTNKVTDQANEVIDQTNKGATSQTDKKII